MVQEKENSQAHSENGLMAHTTIIAIHTKKESILHGILTTRIVTTPTQTTYLP